MVSQIDPTVPIYGFPTTKSVRDNFQIAHDEISALQAFQATGPYLPTIGGEISGDLQVDGKLRVGATVDAGYKLDVAGSARIDSGTGGALPPGVLSSLVIVGADGAAVSSGIVGFGANPAHNIYRAQGTRAAPVAVNNANILGSLGWIGYGATGWSSVRAQILVRTEENWTDTAQGTVIQFFTTALGTITTIEKMRLANSGNLLIGTQTDSGYRLDVKGGTARIDTGSGAAFPAIPQTPGLTIGAADNAAPYSVLFGFGSASGAQWIGYRAGGTRAAPTASVVNQAVSALSGGGYGATGFCTAPRGSVQITTMEAWTDTAQGTGIAFRTTPNGTIATVETMRLAASGNLLIASATDNGLDKLQVTGTARVSSGLGVFGVVAPTVRPAFSGAKAGNAALASVIAILVAAGFATDTTTA